MQRSYRAGGHWQINRYWSSRDTDLSSHRRLTITPSTRLHCQQKTCWPTDFLPSMFFTLVFVLLENHYCYKCVCLTCGSAGLLWGWSWFPQGSVEGPEHFALSFSSGTLDLRRCENHTITLPRFKFISNKKRQKKKTQSRYADAKFKIGVSLQSYRLTKWECQLYRKWLVVCINDFFCLNLKGSGQNKNFI